MSKVAGRKKRIIITTAAMLAIGGGAAFAYWSAIGTDDNAATAGSTAGFTVVSATPSSGTLTPGGPVLEYTYTVTNPGTGVQNLTEVKATVAGTDGTPWTVTGCSATDFTVVSPAITATQLGAGESFEGAVTVQMINKNENQDGCQGKTIPLHFVAR